MFQNRQKMVFSDLVLRLENIILLKFKDKAMSFKFLLF